jgi:hypothetical protein
LGARYRVPTRPAGESFPGGKALTRAYWEPILGGGAGGVIYSGRMGRRNLPAGIWGGETGPGLPVAVTNLSISAGNEDYAREVPTYRESQRRLWNVTAKGALRPTAYGCDPALPRSEPRQGGFR